MESTGETKRITGRREEEEKKWATPRTSAPHCDRVLCNPVLVPSGKSPTTPVNPLPPRSRNDHADITLETGQRWHIWPGMKIFQSSKLLSQVCPSLFGLLRLWFSENSEKIETVCAHLNLARTFSFYYLLTVTMNIWYTFVWCVMVWYVQTPGAKAKI